MAKVLETVERAGLLHHVDKAACKVVQMHVHLTYRGNVHALRRSLAQGLAVDQFQADTETVETPNVSEFQAPASSYTNKDETKMRAAKKGDAQKGKDAKTKEQQRLAGYGNIGPKRFCRYPDESKVQAPTRPRRR